MDNGRCGFCTNWLPRAALITSRGLCAFARDSMSRRCGVRFRLWLIDTLPCAPPSELCPEVSRCRRSIKRSRSVSENDALNWSEEELNERLVAEAHLPFDLENGPLLRVSLFQRSTQEHVLLLALHHIVADFWSLAVLVNELGILYRAENSGVQVTLTPLSLQYS